MNRIDGWAILTLASFTLIVLHLVGVLQGAK